MRLIIYVLITVALFAYDPASFLGHALVSKATNALVDVVQPSAAPLPMPEKAITSSSIQALPEQPEYLQTPEVIPNKKLQSDQSTEQATDHFQQSPETLVKRLDKLLRSIEDENNGGAS